MYIVCIYDRKEDYYWCGTKRQSVQCTCTGYCGGYSMCHVKYIDINIYIKHYTYQPAFSIFQLVQSCCYISSYISYFVPSHAIELVFFCAAWIQFFWWKEQKGFSQKNHHRNPNRPRISYMRATSKINIIYTALKVYYISIYTLYIGKFAYAFKDSGSCTADYIFMYYMKYVCGGGGGKPMKNSSDFF